MARGDDVSLVEDFNVPLQITPGDGNNPCTVFKTDEYQDLCPDGCSYPKDDATSAFTSPAGTSYTVTFCP